MSMQPGLEQSSVLTRSTEVSRAGRSSKGDSARWLRWASSKRILLPLLTLVILLAAWAAAGPVLGVNPLIIPTPDGVLASLVGGFANGQLLSAAWVTLQEILIGFAIGAVFGFLLGALVAEFGDLRLATYPFIVAFQMVPKVAIAPLFIIWFGYGINSKVAIVAAISFFPILINTIVGLRSVDSETLEMMRSFRASRLQIHTRVKVRYALPYIIAGLDVGMSMAVVGAIVAEFVGATAGLGYQILAANNTLDTARVFAILIVLSVMGILLSGAIALIGRRLLFWHASERDR